ncbi:C40 family peptidase [Microtetraspora fusca]|uniref:C40 family peptidase n=1 Tax=Microtetraspora fusca TaxID=1997 RepID=A0ABW6UYU3_MICFU|nr:C40 family peptidase [Microtetraspora fusca]
MEKITTTSVTASTEADASATVATATATKTSSRQSKAVRQRQLARKAVETAKKQLGDPYRWGATGPGAFDCSGLVQYAWRKAGVDIPRTTYSQLSGVKKKVSWSKLKPGDLIFTSGGGHVGMYVGKGKMIHSPHTGAVVRIDKLDAYRKSSFVGAVRPGV